MIYFRGDLLLGQDLQVLNLIYFRGDLLSDPFLGRLVVLGCEVGGRWYPEALRILGSLAEVKSQEAPSLLRQSIRMAWHRRWLGLLSVAAQTALADSLLKPEGPHRWEIDGAIFRPAIFRSFLCHFEIMFRYFLDHF